MTTRRIIAIISIFLLTGTGWWILGIATSVRSNAYWQSLAPQVENLWGRPLAQRAPTFGVQIPGRDEMHWIMPSRNDIQVVLKTDYRKKGLIWYPTYTCQFDGRYTLVNTETVAQKMRLHFDFPAKGATYDDFQILLDDKQFKASVNTREGIGHIVELEPEQSIVLRVKYRTRGMRQWLYNTDRDVGRVKNLNLVVQTDFHKVDFTQGSLSPMSAVQTEKGMMLKWQATDLLTEADIGVIIPEKLNPGPLTSRITFFAPVCLIFFFTLIAAINIMYRIDIHPMHYLFVAAGFFAFHLLLVYLVGHMAIHLAFAIAALTSVALVTGYLSASLGTQFPWKVAAIGQLFFLVLFSYSFFLKGVTGLTVAVGSVITLAILMRVTAHVNWNEVFAQRAVRAKNNRMFAAMKDRVAE